MDTTTLIYYAVSSTPTFQSTILQYNYFLVTLLLILTIIGILDFIRRVFRFGNDR